MLWMQLLAILPLIALGIVLGRRMAHFPNRWWGVGVALPLAIIGLVILGHRSPVFLFIPPVSWAVDADIHPLLMALVIPFLLSTIIPRLAQRRQRIAVGAFLPIVTIYFAVIPLVLPLVVRSQLAIGSTTFDTHGVCLQSHGYTCGPAAAVTVLHALSISADEGSLAIDACTAPGVGTDPWRLQDAINRRSVAQNIHCDFRRVPSLDTLTTPSIADTHLSFICGHYIAVLEVTPDAVIIGDPLYGRQKLTRREFLTRWTGTAHVFTRTSPAVTAQR